MLICSGCRVRNARARRYVVHVIDIHLLKGFTHANRLNLEKNDPFSCAMNREFLPATKRFWQLVTIKWQIRAWWARYDIIYHRNSFFINGQRQNQLPSTFLYHLNWSTNSCAKPYLHNDVWRSHPIPIAPPRDFQKMGHYVQTTMRIVKGQKNDWGMCSNNWMIHV